MLPILAEKSLQHAVNPQHLAYSPTMDLIALSTVDEKVNVYRLNGQKVFGVTSKQHAVKVSCIKWRPNGQTLAVAFSNNMIHLTNAHTGKTIYQIDGSVYSSSHICSLGWAVNVADMQAIRAGTENPSDGPSSIDTLGHRNEPNNSIPNLPNEMASLDVEGILPKLSSLSPGGKEDDVFDSRTSLDSLFQTLTNVTNSADTLVMGFEDSTIHLSIYDFFEIGSFNLQEASQCLDGCRPLLHRFHPDSTTHALLLSTTIPRDPELYVVPLDLRLVSSAGKYLYSLASKSTQMHNILRYIRRVQSEMYVEFKAAQDLPSKFIRNIEEKLRNKSDCTWVNAAYHFVVTGHCCPEIKEWLVDELGERGQKRWEKAITTGYENVRRLAHENLLPALERFTVLLSRLRGLSRFQQSHIALGLSTQELDNIIDTVNSLQLLAHNILIYASSELRQFAAFCTWLREEIELQSTDQAFTLSDSNERNTNIDHATTLKYIQGAMSRSRLQDFFNFGSQTQQTLEWNLVAEGRSLFELYKKELKNFTRKEASGKQLPGLDALIAHLDGQCNLVFARIAETQRRHVRVGSPVALRKGILTCMDMRILVEHGKELNGCVLYVATVSSSEPQNVLICRINLKIENGVSSTKNTEYAFTSNMPGDIRDLKFVDDHQLMLAVSRGSSSCLLSFVYRQRMNSSKGMTYTRAPIVNEGSFGSILDFRPHKNTDINTDILVWQTFPSGPAWTPERIEVNNRKNRQTVCVLAEDRVHYRIYDIERVHES